MKVALNLVLILVASLLCLFAVEGLTRLVLDDGMLYELEMWKYAREVKMRDARPDLGHRHRPQAEARLMGVDVRTDSRGLRGPEIADKAAAGVARIAFVGDSITMGWGVAEKETFTHQVIEGLVKAGRKVDGFNLGVGNYNTLQELSLFREVGAPLKPDIVVLAYFINDAEPMPSYSDTGWIATHSAAWVVAGYRFDSLFRQFGEAPDWKRYYRDLYEPKAKGWLQTQKALGDFAATAREPRRPAHRLQHPRAARAKTLSLRRHHGQGPRRRRKGRRALRRPPADRREPRSGEPLGDRARSASQRQSRDHLRPRHDPAPPADAGRALPHQGQRLLTEA